MKLKEPEVIYKSGKPTAVILPLAEYNELLELVEDAADIAYLKKARRGGMSFRPFLRIRQRANGKRGQAPCIKSSLIAGGKDLDRLSAVVYRRVQVVIASLAENPRPPGCRKLAGSGTDWRVRVGDYRIIYEIADTVRIVRVTRVRHRSDVYR